MANNTYQAPVSNEKREKVTLNVEPAAFPGTMKTALTTTNALVKAIYAMFQGVNNDFEGCTLEPNRANGQLELTLYFTDKPMVGGNKIKNVTNVVNNDPTASPMERIRAVNVRNSNRLFDLTDDTKDILEDFIFGPRNQKINWKQHLIEKTDRGQVGYRVYVAVVGIDISKVLKKLYGAVNEEGERVDYQLNIITPINSNFAQSVQNYLISIIQLNNKSVEKLCSEIGVNANTGSIPMFRG